MTNAKTKKGPRGAARKERIVAIKPSGKIDGNGGKAEPGKNDGSHFDLIHELVRQIPRGRVTSYGAIAAVLNISNPRMVGRAMGASGSDGIPFPAQRVVNSTGRISGDHRDHRRKLLEKEGVRVKGDKIVDFKDLFWDPAKELE